MDVEEGRADGKGALVPSAFMASSYTESMTIFRMVHKTYGVSAAEEHVLRTGAGRCCAPALVQRMYVCPGKLT